VLQKSQWQMAVIKGTVLSAKTEEKRRHEKNYVGKRGERK
jgi:hypothetical protein